MIRDPISRLVSWVVHKVGPITLLWISLLLFLLSSLVYGLVEVVRDLNSGMLMALALLGLLAGWLLARTRMTGMWAALSGAGLGVGLLLARTGQIAEQGFVLIRALNDLVTGLLHWRPLAPLPDLQETWLALQELGASLGALLARLQLWLSGFQGTEAVFDPVAASLVWSLGVWLAALWAAWAVRRLNQPLAAAAPAMGLLGACLAYARHNPLFLLFMLASALLLAGWQSMKNREVSWLANQIDYPEDLRIEVGMATFLLTMVLISAAFVAPKISIQGFLDALNAPRQPPVAAGTARVGQALGIQPRPAPVIHAVWQDHRYGGLPRSHLLGMAPELSQQIAMTVSIGELPPPGRPEEALPARPRYYWRALSYDQYTGRGWLTGPTRLIDYRAGQAIYTPESPPPTAAEEAQDTFTPVGRVVPQHFEIQEESLAGTGLLYSAGTLLAADQDYEVAWRELPVSGDPVSTDPFGARVETQEYTAEGLVVSPSAQDLRSAGSDYPQWVRERYLSLPDDLPARVRSLSLDLTATQPTVYDRVRAIEAYLRTYPYNLDLPLPPDNRDVVDYFLFDLQRGYCDYYATAMVVLARAAGVPARLSIGYAQGQFDPEESRFVVVEANAHSWPEVYFPGYGWIPFEPTAGLPPIAHRGEQEPAVSPPEVDEPTGARNRPALSWGQTAGWAAALAGLALGGFLAWSLADIWRLQRLSPPLAVAAIYRRLYRRGAQLAVSQTQGSTPHEFAGSFARQLAGFSPRWGPVVTAAAADLQGIIDLYTRTIYGPHPIQAADKRQAISLWQRLRWRLWLAGMLQKVTQRWD